MLAFANSYTSGTSDARSSGSTVATTGPETRVATLRHKVTNNTLSKSWLQWASAKLDDIAKLNRIGIRMAPVGHLLWLSP